MNGTKQEQYVKQLITNSALCWTEGKARARAKIFSGLANLALVWPYPSPFPLSSTMPCLCIINKLLT